jgi:glutamate synthase domain-containing protein 1
MLDWTVVHNGEISSYGINKRLPRNVRVQSTMQTDTEVMAYAFDLLVRRQHLPISVVAKILAPPLWSEIKAMKPENELALRALRQTYGSLLMNGPFT